MPRLNFFQVMCCTPPNAARRGLRPEGGFGQYRTQPYEIPYRALLPKARQATNLLVPVALSASHVAFSTIRMGSVWSMLGHTAGLAAALAIEQGQAVQQVDAAALRGALLAQGQVLDARPFTGVWPSSRGAPGAVVGGAGFVDNCQGRLTLRSSTFHRVTWRQHGRGTPTFRVVRSHAFMAFKRDVTTTIPQAEPRVQVTATTLPRRRHEPPAGQSLPFRERRWVGPALFLGDVLAMELALLLGWLLREKLLAGWLGPALAPGQYQALAIGMLALPLTYLFVGLYPGYGMSMVERLRRRVYTVCLLFALLIMWDYVVLKGHTSRGVLLFTFSFAVVLGPMIEAGIRKVLLACRAWGTPVAVLGAGSMGELLVRVLRQEPELGYVPIAAFDDDTTKWGRPLEGIPVLGGLSRSRMLAPRVSVALLAMPGTGGARQAYLCGRLPFPKVILIPDLMGISSLWVSSRDLGGVIGLEVKKNLSERRNWYFKRTVDYLLGVPLFLLSLPLLGLFALWIKLVSPDGPVFYHQERVGFGGRTFHVWKLRTMHPDAELRLEKTLANDPEASEQWQQTCKMKDDPRVLPGVGRLLRRTSLDELPQFWNILRGEMSLVGPRPFPAYHLSRFQPPFRALRRRVLPGLTGLWQVSARSDGDIIVQEVLDTYYIRNWSIWLDLYLLVRTVGAVLVGRGAY